MNKNLNSILLEYTRNQIRKQSYHKVNELFLGWSSFCFCVFPLQTFPQHLLAPQTPFCSHDESLPSATHIYRCLQLHHLHFLLEQAIQVTRQQDRRSGCLSTVPSWSETDWRPEQRLYAPFYTVFSRLSYLFLFVQIVIITVISKITYSIK